MIRNFDKDINLNYSRSLCGLFPLYFLLYKMLSFFQYKLKRMNNKSTKPLYKRVCTSLISCLLSTILRINFLLLSQKSMVCNIQFKVPNRSGECRLIPFLSFFRSLKRQFPDSVAIYFFDNCLRTT